jgi:hypothetical protein
VTIPAPSDPVTPALQKILAAQHAAVFAYSVIGVQLADTGQIQQARAVQAAHRLTRDAIMTQLDAVGATPVSPDSQYTPSEAVTDETTAQRWALALEQDCAAAYRYLLTTAATAPGNQAAPRKQGLTGLTTAASLAMYWRNLVTPATPTDAFPGL